MSNRIFCKIKRQNALILKFRQLKRKFISSRDKFGIVFFCSLSKNMNKITAIELFTGAFRQKWLSETLFQISIYLFFEYSNIITNYSKMGLEIKKWKFDMKPRGPQSSFDRILLKVFEFGQKKANKNVQSADINFPLLPPR